MKIGLFNIKWFYPLFIQMLLLSICPAGVSADEPLKIYGNHDKAPKTWNEGGQPKGILVDMMNWISRESGQEFIIELYPWKRAYLSASEGDAGLFGLSMTQERLELFDYSDVMYFDDMVLVVKKGETFAFNNIEDLRGKVIAVLRGGSFGDEFVRGSTQGIFQAIETNTPLQSLQMLNSYRVDVVLMGPGEISVHTVIRNNPTLLGSTNSYDILSKPFKRDPNYLGFAKSMQKVNYLKVFNRYLKRGWQSGAFEKIITNYNENALQE